jgi:hypothetical protein
MPKLAAKDRLDKIVEYTVKQGQKCDFLPSFGNTTVLMNLMIPPPHEKWMVSQEANYGNLVFVLGEKPHSFAVSQLMAQYVRFQHSKDFEARLVKLEEKAGLRKTHEEGDACCDNCANHPTIGITALTKPFIIPARQTAWFELVNSPFYDLKVHTWQVVTRDVC